MCLVLVRIFDCALIFASCIYMSLESKAINAASDGQSNPTTNDFLEGFQSDSGEARAVQWGDPLKQKCLPHKVI
jgi:hypothetical protein